MAKQQHINGRFQPLPPEDLSDRGAPICCRFSRDVDAKLRAMSDRSAFIRDAVAKALQS